MWYISCCGNVVITVMKATYMTISVNEWSACRQSGTGNGVQCCNTILLTVKVALIADHTDSRLGKDGIHRALQS